MLVGNIDIAFNTKPQSVKIVGDDTLLNITKSFNNDYEMMEIFEKLATGNYRYKISLYENGTLIGNCVSDSEVSKDFFMKTVELLKSLQ